MEHKRYGPIFTIIAFLLLGVFLAASLYLVQRFDYKWTWHKMGTYFVTHKVTSIQAEGNGTFERGADGAFFLKGKENHIPLHLEGYDLKVKEGDLVFIGDEIATKTSYEKGSLIEGLIVTLEISLLSTLFGLILGLITGLCKAHKNPIYKIPATFYVETIRGTPLLVQLFIVYFMIGPVIGIDNRFICGVIALSLFAGAYAGEIFRSGIENCDKGQFEAARSLGMTAPQTMLYVVLPQVVRATLPALAGTFISLIKDSSLVSVMALTDLTKAGREIVASSFMVFEVWITVALLYFLLTYAMSYGVKRLETAMAKGMTHV